MQASVAAQVGLAPILCLVSHFKSYNHDRHLELLHDVAAQVVTPSTVPSLSISVSLTLSLTIGCH